MATQSRIGWRPYVNVVTQVVNAVDADATAFITAAGITDLTQASAINTLVNDLKTYGLWTKMRALYPFVGGSATSHKFNLKDPRDLDAAYRLVFNGGWTHTSNGALPNGTTGYADTKLVPSSILTSPFIGYYSRSNTNTGTDQIDMGAKDPNNRYLWISAWYNGSGFSNILARNSSLGVLLNGGATTDSRGWCWTNKVSTTAKLGKNSTILTSATDTETPPNTTIFIGAYRADNNPALYSNRETAFSVIADGMSDTDTTNLYTSIQKFNTTLGRHVGTPYVSDADAVSFLTAAGITDGTQAAAINTLVTDLKVAGIWTKMKAVYPFVGGSATSHKFNLKDPRDSDAAYRLVFNGGWTHTSTGIKGNGTTGYANTYLSTHTLAMNSGFGYYSRTNSTVGSQADMGALWYYPVQSSGVGMSSGTTYISMNSNDFISFSDTDTRGFYQGYRINTLVKGLKNTTSYSATIAYSAVNAFSFIGARSEIGAPSLYSVKEFALAYFQENFTDTDASNMYTIVQKFQTTLGRQVDVPVVSDSDAQAFLNAASITSYTQANAVNILVTDLKAAGVWTKIKALYPFVGGNATSHKFNLKDPRDLDAAYRLVFNGGWTHTSTGALSNGTTGYANTYLNLQLLNQNNTHLSLYNNNNYTPTTGSIDMGAYNELGSISGVFIATELVTNLSRARLFITPLDYSITDNRGYYIVNSNSTNTKYHINNTNVAVSANSGSFPLISKNIFIGALNANANYDGANYFSNGLYTFSSIGDGLTDTESTALYSAVQKFQTSLGRQIGTPIYNTNELVLNLDTGNANSYPGTGTIWYDLASGNNGTLVNGSTYDSTNGGSILFDGVNDRVSTFVTKFPDANSKTIDVWFKSTSSVRQGLCGTRPANGVVAGWVFTINRTATGNLTYFHTGSGVAEFSAGIVMNTWYNAVVTHDYTTGLAKVYLNGNLIGSANVGTINSSSFNGTIGDEDGSIPSTPFKGNIPKVVMYNRVLSSTEVLQNFNSSRGRFGV
jgi:hypothetical protein